MMRYRPRLPVFGTSMQKKKKEEFGGASDFTVKQMLGGGPVERAIKADLISLRTLFHERIIQTERDIGSVRASGILSLYDAGVEGSRKGRNVSSMHRPRGYSFRVFKEVFKESKFGIIFTRAAPPISRIDKEAYVQLIYSAALSLLKDVQKDQERQQKQQQQQQEIEQNEQSTTIFFNAVFAIYALYTLYNTNPAPRVPQQEERRERNTMSSSILPSALPPTPNEQELLSTLPVGLSDTVNEAETKYYRRSYHSPIRISYESMQRVIQLRNQSFLAVDQCHHKLYEHLSCQDHPEDNILDDSDSDGKSNTNAGDGSLMQFICRCSLANDCITLIDRLISYQCFQFCEYDGPVSVESLGGSDDYVRQVIVNDEQQQEQAEKNNDSNVIVINDHDDCDHHNKNNFEKSLDEVDPSSISEKCFFDSHLDKLQESFCQYQDIVGKLSLCLRTSTSLGPQKNFNSKKNQLALVQKSIEPVMKERQRRCNFNLRQKIHRALSITTCNNRNETTASIMTSADEEQQQEQYTVGGSNEGNQMELTPQQQVQMTNRPSLRFTYPETFSDSLREGLDNLLKEIITLEDKEGEQQEHNKKDTRRVSLENDYHDFFLFNEDSDASSDISDTGDDILHDNEDLNSIGTLESLHFSRSGKAALQLLLQKAIGAPVDKDSVSEDGNLHRSRSTKNGSKKRPPSTKGKETQKKRKTAITPRIQCHQSDEISVQSKLSIATAMIGDNESVVTNILGSGKAALQELLEQAGSGHHNTSMNRDGHSISTNQPRKNKKSYDKDGCSSLVYKQRSNINATDDRISSTDDHSLHSKLSSTTIDAMVGSGRDALQQLLHEAAKPSKVIQKPKVRPTRKRKTTQKKSNEPKSTHNSRLNINTTDDDNYSFHSKLSSTTIDAMVGSGREALQQLLHEAAKPSKVIKKPKVQPTMKRKTTQKRSNEPKSTHSSDRKKRKKQSTSCSDENDSERDLDCSSSFGSVNSSIEQGEGRAALQMLLEASKI